MKNYLVDTIGALVFFTIAAALSELFIAGMEPGQVLIARVIMIPVVVITARPYGLWRDWLFAALRPQRRIANVGSDIAAFVAFQVPVYAATLAVAGAALLEITTAVSAAIVSMILLSRPFGLYLEALRTWFGTSVT